MLLRPPLLVLSDCSPVRDSLVPILRMNLCFANVCFVRQALEPHSPQLDLVSVDDRPARVYVGEPVVGYAVVAAAVVHSDVYVPRTEPMMMSVFRTVVHCLSIRHSNFWVVPVRLSIDLKRD